MLTPSDAKVRINELQNSPPEKIAPPKWLFAISLPIAASYFIWMGYSLVILSQQWHDKARNLGYPLFLLPGWIGNRRMDLTDPQWITFRSNIMFLTTCAVLYLIGSTIIKNILCKKSKTPLLLYYVTVSLGFMCYLYGLSVVFPFLVIIINYVIGRVFRSSRWNTMFTWTFNLLVLFSSKYYQGYRFLDILGKDYFHLDNHRGVMQWETYFNLMFCKLVSFNIDHRDSRIAKQQMDSGEYREVEIKAEWDENRQRMSRPLDPDQDYGILSYLAYVTYLPLFIAGPVISYNAYYSYVMQKPQQEVDLKGRILATCQVYIYAILLDAGLHFIYCNGFNEKGIWKNGTESYLARSDMKDMSPAMVATMGLATLLYMYMKFLVIWRFFRVWALWDDVNPPENMNRCIINNYTVSGFWRSWHSSLNLWIVKYIYVPMGGSKHKFWSVWIIFGFIALWHDLMWRWIAWAMMNGVLFVIETTAVTIIAPTAIIQNIKEKSNHQFKPYYNVLVAATSTFMNIGLVLTNLAIMHGFYDSYLFVMRVYGNNEGPFMMVASFVIVFAVGEVALWKRERERIQGAHKIY